MVRAGIGMIAECVRFNGFMFNFRCFAILEIIVGCTRKASGIIEGSR